MVVVDLTVFIDDICWSNAQTQIVLTTVWNRVNPFNDFDTITTEAAKIAAWAEAMPDYFPEGSGAGTSARAEIWTDFASFKDAAEAHYNAAQDLITVAAKKDSASTGDALKALGATCKACHQKFKSW